MNNTKTIETTPPNDDEDELFYFESDHLALRGNIDYSEVLKTMFILEAQRARALQDYNKVVDLKKMYLNDPMSYIEKSKTGDLGIPEMQKIAEVPKINWSKYSTNVPEQFMCQINSTQMQVMPKEADSGKNYKSWTPEEQRKLEELLIKYPPEEVDRKRIVKIANEMGTRTREQVASRLQKYFLKLLQAGLPIPGRLPRAARKYSERKQGYKSAAKFSYRKHVKPSTFFPETFIPVVMDDMHAPGPSTSFHSNDGNSNTGTKDELSQSNYLLSNNYHVDKKSTIKRDDVHIEMALLKWVKSEKELESQRALHQHYGYKCDYCDEEPIQGTRWHCTTCINDSVDYCTDCILSQFYSSNAHDLQHKFLVIRNEKEVTNGFWSESESESDDGKSNDGEEGSESEDSRSGVSSVAGSDNISKISEECPSDIFDPNHRNGFDYKAEEL